MVKKVAVVGSTGQVGFPLSIKLLGLGHEVVAVSRGRTQHNEGKLRRLEEGGAQLAFSSDYSEVDELADVFSGCDTVVVAIRVNARIVREVEPKILQSAQKAGVGRFVPDEFGTHTMALEYGACTLFDAKKDIHKLLFKSGLEWTLIFAGGIFDYFLPNLRMFEKVTTFGNTSLTFPTHDIKDIAAIAARAVVDPRTVNKGVQLYANVVTQDEMIALLRRSWPEHDFEVVHISAEEITYQKEHGDPNAISAKGGAEPDQERHGINYTNFVLGKMASVDDPNTLSANDLYPEYEYRKPSEALSDRKFVFGVDTE